MASFTSSWLEMCCCTTHFSVHVNGVFILAPARCGVASRPRPTRRLLPGPRLHPRRSSHRRNLPAISVIAMTSSSPIISVSDEDKQKR